MCKFVHCICKVAVYVQEFIGHWISTCAVFWLLFSEYKCCGVFILRFRIKYHPDECVSHQGEARRVLKHRCQVFMKLLELGWLSNISVDNDYSNELIRMLDAGCCYCCFHYIVSEMFLKKFCQWFNPPLLLNRHHWSNCDCLEGKRENYQVCSVQYCVQQLCTVQCTHIWTDLTVLLIGFCLTGPISLCVDSFLCMYYFVYIACMCSIVTWWGGPGGIEAYP